ncbi:MAG: hypothetical protein KDE55_03250 [Novosphingobium sp.]|nr:hypothetical protein [Novosphingobium sp.]
MTGHALPLTAALLALALGGCAQESEPEQPTDSTEVSGEALGPPPPADLPVQEEPASSTEAASQDEDTIPPPVQGRWGLVPGDCASDRGDEKGLLTIGPDKLEFYESVALLGTIKERDESRIRATFTFSGEGETWIQDVVLDAQDDGKTLIRRDYGHDAMPGPLKYTHC